MGLTLPVWQDLSKDEQIPIINLPMTANYVVVGGPGTGKTIMALHRAAKWRDENGEKHLVNGKKDVLFLVYNRPISWYLKDALEAMKLNESHAQTWHSWFYNFYFKLTGEKVPETSRYNPDWQAVLNKIGNESRDKCIEHLILDEAQDFPKELLVILNLFSRRITVFGDPNQAIENKTTLADFTNALDAGGKVYHLSRNYRNTEEISNAAALFYTGSKDDIPAASKRRGNKPSLYQCASYEDCIKFISDYADNNPSEMIGVLLPSDRDVRSVIKRYAADIEKRTDADVQYYIGKSDTNEFNFQSDGVKVLSYKTAKGLEFDTVFLPEINHEKLDKPDDTQLQNAVYVAASRAKNSLFFVAFDDYGDNYITKRIKQNSDLINYKIYK